MCFGNQILLSLLLVYTSIVASAFHLLYILDADSAANSLLGTPNMAALHA